jgi:hypothetical protein
MIRNNSCAEAFNFCVLDVVWILSCGFLIQRLVSLADVETIGSVGRQECFSELHLVGYAIFGQVCEYL